MITAARWHIFRALCHIGWHICPEPRRSELLGSMSYDETLWRRK
jgi:hypothetical protein